ncbi:MAG: hypothetical protein HPY85_03295 [Anaerolineae bacterium]|nr:hypothetical protein [Anaerolineae bacterium]
MMETVWKALNREEVKRAVERRHPPRIPLVQAKWWGEGLVEQYGGQLQLFDRYPEDVVFAWIDPIVYSKMNLSWQMDDTGAHDSRAVLADWEKLDEFIEKLPKAANDPRFEDLLPIVERAHREDRYLMFAWWRLFFERPWGIRGMTNLLMDYYLYPDQIHRLNAALCDVYLDYIQTAISLLQPDGFWCSDDLGTQKALFMKPATFREFLKPYYRQVGELTKGNGLHWWLHSCGNNTDVLEDLIETGLDVFHPVQKHTMDERQVAERYGNRLTFLAGIDVQHVLQEQIPEGVRKEVRFLIDTFDQEAGGMCIAAGNGIVAGTPFDNIHAFLDESLIYGEKHRQQRNSA